MNETIDQKRDRQAAAYADYCEAMAETRAYGSDYCDACERELALDCTGCGAHLCSLCMPLYHRAADCRPDAEIVAPWAGQGAR